MKTNEVILSINSNPYSAREALQSSYKGKVFVVVDKYSERLDRFRKTKRGAEGYIKKQQNISYYDDYSQEMTHCGTGLEVIEVQENDILDPVENISVWYHYLKGCYWQEWSVSNTLKMVKDFKVSEDVMAFVNETCNTLLTETGFTIIDQYETPEEIEEFKATALDIEQVEEVQQETGIANQEELIKTTQEATQQPTGITYKLNDEKQGVEIYFDSKPSEEVRNLLKANGFRWGKFNKCWYSKHSKNTLTIAQQLAGEQPEDHNRGDITELEYNNQDAPEQPQISITDSFAYPEIDIDDCSDGKYNISQELQDRENDNSMFRSSKRDHNKEVQELFTRYTEQVKEVLSITDNEYYIYKLKSALQRFKKNYHQAYIKYISHKGLHVSWMISGRSGLNISKYNKDMDRQDKLMSELVSLLEELKREISKYKNKIRKDKDDQLKAQLQAELSQPLPELEFKTVTKEFDLYNNGSMIKTRFYECENYSICKVWGAFRVFNKITGKEIYSTKSNGTLKDAKAYVQLQIKKQQETVLQAI